MNNKQKTESIIFAVVIIFVFALIYSGFGFQRMIPMMYYYYPNPFTPFIMMVVWIILIIAIIFLILKIVKNSQTQEKGMKGKEGKGGKERQK